MMSVLSKALVVSLFVLFSAVLFTALLPPVSRALFAFYGYQSSPAVPAVVATPEVIWEDGHVSQATPASAAKAAVTPLSIAENFFMTSWVSITVSLSLSVTAAIFLAIGQITHRFKQWRAKQPLVAKMP